MEDCCAGHPAIREKVERADDCSIPADKVTSLHSSKSLPGSSRLLA